jgi:hypothetical protein
MIYREQLACASKAALRAASPLATSAARIGRNHSGGPLRRIHECAVETGQPRRLASFVGPRARHLFQVMPGGWGRGKIYAIRYFFLSKSYELRIVLP